MHLLSHRIQKISLYSSNPWLPVMRHEVLPSVWANDTQVFQTKSTPKVGTPVGFKKRYFHFKLEPSIPDFVLIFPINKRIFRCFWLSKKKPYEKKKHPMLPIPDPIFPPGACPPDSPAKGHGPSFWRLRKCHASGNLGRLGSPLRCSRMMFQDGVCHNHLKQPLKKVGETLHLQGTIITCQFLGLIFPCNKVLMVDSGRWTAGFHVLMWGLDGSMC